MPSRPGAGVMWTRVETFFQGSFAKEWSSIFWFLNSGAVAPADYKGDSLALHVAIVDAILPMMASTNECVGSSVVINNGAGSYGSEVYAEAPGSIVQTAIPEDVSLVVQRLTGNAGPSNRGRIFIAGLPETFVTGSYLSTVGLAAAATLVTALQTAVAGNVVTYTPATFSQKDGILTAVTSWFPVALLATNRRRRPRF
jgi:hypothetical protein